MHVVAASSGVIKETKGFCSARAIGARVLVELVSRGAEDVRMTRSKKSTVPQFELRITLKPVARSKDGMAPDRVVGFGTNLVANSLAKLPAGARVRLAYDIPGQRG